MMGRKKKKEAGGEVQEAGCGLNGAGVVCLLVFFAIKDGEIDLYL